MVQPIQKTIEVPCNPETAFDILVGKTATWWPLDRHSVSAMNGKTARSVTIEQSVGGRVYETGAEGEIIPWGSVTVFEPGERIVIAWHINKPEAEATEVEFRFTSAGPSSTRVDLEHRGFDASAPDAQEFRDRYANGWVTVFETCYGEGCVAEAA